ncbi:MAG: putative zinc-binding metallopeptidase [Mesorhizobium sp.]|nr:putative zinc-binding metallopeptidase [Mesorhizobium sp.]
MKLFACPSCTQQLYFENTRCLACDSIVLYEPRQAMFVVAGASGAIACANSEQCACNWVAAKPGGFCRACQLNKTIPDLTVGGNRERWIRVEAAKKRVIYSLLSFGLDVEPKSAPGSEVGIAFDFLADPSGGGGPGGERILTGHDNGVITLNVAEADSPEREKRRIAMGETYRTLLGHFRHELGHYYWDRLIRDDAAWLDRFRATFGDERPDYEEALKLHYATPPAADWQMRHISAYAASHPWEDWAETWAHYLHIVDTLEMADSLKWSIGAMELASGPLLTPDTDRGAGRDDGQDPGDDGAEYPPASTGAAFDATLGRWIVLSNASNSINRCMGLPDLYPFVISQVVAEKLAFIDDLLRR